MDERANDTSPSPLNATERFSRGRSSRINRYDLVPSACLIYEPCGFVADQRRNDS
jgi:hypothetical protein